MANWVNKKPLGQSAWQGEVDDDPAAGAGTEAPVGSIVRHYTDGREWSKTGAGDTDWERIDAQEAQVLLALAATTATKDLGGGAIANVGNIGGVDMVTDVPANTSHRSSDGSSHSLSPTSDEKAALAGTGTPGAGDKYVNNSDSRMTDERVPVDLSVTDAKVAAANKDGAAGTPSMRTLGTGAAQAAAGDHGHSDLVARAETDASGYGFVLDEDDMASNDDTKVPTQQSVIQYVTGKVAGLLNYQGGYDANANSPDLDVSPSGVKKGDFYTVTAAGAFFSAPVEIGDSLVAEVDDADEEAEWTIVQANLTPASIKTQYESNADTNAFTNAEKTTLGNQSGTNTGDEPDATTSAKGVVELATDGESAANVAVQGNDSRLSDARTPTSHASSHDPASGADGLGLLPVWVDGVKYRGTRTIGEIDALGTPPWGTTVVAGSAGTPSAGGSDTLAIGDIAEYRGPTALNNGWRIIVPHSSNAPPAGTRLAADDSYITIFSPLVDNTDNGKIAVFPGASLTPGLVTLPEGGRCCVTNTSAITVTRSYVLTDTVPNGDWDPDTVPFYDAGNGLERNWSGDGKLQVHLSSTGSGLKFSSTELRIKYDDATIGDDGSGNLEIKPTTKLAANYVEPAHVSTDGSHGDTVAVSFKAVDYKGNDKAAVTPFRWWLSSDNSTGALHGTTPDGGVSATTGVKIDDTTANLAGHGITDASGDAVLSVNHVGGAATYYLWVEMNGVTMVSDAITIT